MNSFERKLNRTKNKVAGAIKQTAGKITGDDVLELKGRMQSAGADLQKKTDVDDGIRHVKQSVEKGKASAEQKFNQAQQSVAKNINDLLDERAQRKPK